MTISEQHIDPFLSDVIKVAQNDLLALYGKDSIRFPTPVATSTSPRHAVVHHAAAAAIAGPATAVLVKERHHGVMVTVVQRRR